ncbi:MAG: hypothetical protein AAFY29_14335 [Pseudomonadota bacterium]
MKIVIFTWHSRKNLELVLPLARYLDKHCGAEIEFITSDTSGKISLAVEGYRASTVNELILAFANDPDPDPAAYDPKLGALDLKVDWLWTPPDVLTPPAGATMASETYRRWKVVQFLRSYDGFLREVRPQVVMTWNGTLAVTRCLTQAASKYGLGCFFMERGLVPGTLVVDSKGVNYESEWAGSLPATIPTPTPERRAAIKSLCHDLREGARSVVNTGSTIEEQDLIERLDIDAESTIILLPLQIENDTNIVENSSLVKSMVAMIAEVEKAIDGLACCVVVKPHPEDARRRDVIERACAGSQLRCSWDCSLHSLLAVSDQVIVINSTVGLEALMQNIPVIALGNSVYNQKGFTTDVNDFAELRNAIAHATTPPYATETFWQFMNQLISHGVFSYDSEDPWGNRESVGRRVVAFGEDLAEVWEKEPAPPRQLENRETVRQLLNGESTVPTTILGGFEPPFGRLPASVKGVENAAAAVRAILTFSRPEVLIVLQPRVSLAKRIFARLLRPRQLVEIH